jgi:hypothetical protein
MASLTDDDEDTGPDPRIEQLKEFLKSNSDAKAVIAHLKSLGTAPVVIADTLVSVVSMHSLRLHAPIVRRFRSKRGPLSAKDLVMPLSIDDVFRAARARVCAGERR